MFNCILIYIYIYVNINKHTHTLKTFLNISKTIDGMYKMAILNKLQNYEKILFTFSD